MPTNQPNSFLALPGDSLPFCCRTPAGYHTLGRIEQAHAQRQAAKDSSEVPLPVVSHRSSGFANLEAVRGIVNWLAFSRPDSENPKNSLTF